MPTPRMSVEEGTDVSGTPAVPTPAPLPLNAPDVESVMQLSPAPAPALAGEVRPLLTLEVFAQIAQLRPAAVRGLTTWMTMHGDDPYLARDQAVWALLLEGALHTPALRPRTPAQPMGRR